MGDMDYTLRVEGEFDESDQIKNLVLGTQNNKTIYLHDVATVRDTLKDITLEQTINRGNGGVLMVTKQTDANAVAVANQAKKEIEKAMKELPSDIKFQIISDNSDFIVKSINNLQESLMYALIFVVLVVFLFLGRWRATFIIALTIPISLIVAFIYLFATGESLNVISLSSLSIAIGMVYLPTNFMKELFLSLRTARNFRFSNSTTCTSCSPKTSESRACHAIVGNSPDS